MYVLHAQVCEYRCTCVSIDVQVFVCEHVSMQMFIHVLVFVVHVCTRMCMPVCMYVCL